MAINRCTVASEQVLWAKVPERIGAYRVEYRRRWEHRMKLLDRIARRFMRPQERDLTGVFDYSSNLITGWTVDRWHPLDRHLAVSVLREDEVIAQTHVCQPGEVGWCFQTKLGGRVSDLDVLHERIRVVVRDRAGRSHALRLEGSTQLQLIQEHFSDPVEPLVDIDFREGGNSEAFLGTGWSFPETSHRWTVGVQSGVMLRTLPTDRDCYLTILLWPFTVGGLITQQRLEVMVNQSEVGRFEVTHQSFVRCLVPCGLLKGQALVEIGFGHPDAASEVQLKVGGDPRQLALAFKRLKLLPVA